MLKWLILDYGAESITFVDHVIHLDVREMDEAKRICDQ